MKAEEGKASPPNEEVELDDKNLIAKIVMVKVLCPAVYARGPFENMMPIEHDTICLPNKTWSEFRSRV